MYTQLNMAGLKECIGLEEKVVTAEALTDIPPIVQLTLRIGATLRRKLKDVFSKEQCMDVAAEIALELHSEASNPDGSALENNEPLAKTA